MVIFHGKMLVHQSNKNQYIIELASKVLFAVPSGKRLHNYAKSHFFHGKFTISMVIFYRYVKLPDVRIYGILWCR